MSTWPHNVTYSVSIQFAVSQFQGSVKNVQQLAKDVRPYAAVSDHVLNNSSRDERTAVIVSW